MSLGLGRKNKKASLYYVVTFGKHKGESLGAILAVDPKYIIWLEENKALEMDEKIVLSARTTIENDEASFGHYK